MRRHALHLGGLSIAILGALAGCPQRQQGSDGEGEGGVLGSLVEGAIGGVGRDRAPTATASIQPQSNIFGGTAVVLDGSASSDPEGGALSFAWSQSGGPAVTLLAADAAKAEFVVPFAAENQTLAFRLTVRDPSGNAATADVSFAVGAGGEFAGNAQSASAYRDKLSAEEAYHLLRRAALGASPAEVDRAVARGLTATVNDLLDSKPMSQTVAALADSYQDDVDQRWLVFMIEGPNPLRERMALFWHDRFATARRVATDYRDRQLGVVHADMLRTHALGNYRQLLEELTLDPLMLLWLNGEDSPKSNPNENYAREFWELFTLGRDTVYTEQDIKEGARAFTGITLLREPNQITRPIYDLLNHDETLKTIFPGRAPAANYNFESAIDLTLTQPEAARYVARNLFACFVHDHPSDALVEELARSLREDKWELAPLVRRILMSQALFSSEARFNQVASPVEHVVGVARTLEMHLFSEDSQGYVFDQLADDLRGAGQELLDPPGVEGWHEDAAWLEGQWIISRVRALGRTMEYGPGNTPDLPYHLLPPPSTWSAREARGQLVDALAKVFHLKPTAQERDAYIYVLDDGGYYALYLQKPEDRPRHVAEMLRLMAMDAHVMGR